MSLFSSSLIFSPLGITIILSLFISCFFIIIIWIIQLKDNRRHYALSFMFVWLLLGCILGILNQFLLQSEAFPFFLFYPSADAETDASIDDRLGLTPISSPKFTTLAP